jgi:hypothetical protein
LCRTSRKQRAAVVVVKPADGCALMELLRYQFLTAKNAQKDTQVDKHTMPQRFFSALYAFFAIKLFF